MRKIILLILVLSIGKSEFGGGYAGAPMRYGSNAREIALAGALIAESNTGFHQFSNPALLPNVDNIEFGVSYFQMSLDRSIQLLTVNRKLPPKAGAGLSIFRAGVDNIQGRDYYGNKTEMLSSNDIYGMLSFGVSFTSKVSAGLNLKIMFNELLAKYDELSPKFNSQGIGLDFGFLYNFSNKLSFGGKYSNILAGTTWKVDLDDQQKSYEEQLPQILSAGIKYQIIPEAKLLVQWDGIRSADHEFESKYRVGLEYIYDGIFMLRSGLNNFSPTFGFGLIISAWNQKNIQMDYSLDYGRRGEGLSHNFSWWMEM
ncbi:MAG: hypothetical protein ISR90_05905 [Candidatus Marinimicrobia bacterium]|nr:hypothetical protein [Candidatus Neomarinimicrobiota bacterium]MBL7023567.1 hypothetical protein [Candidatus Neomarinimicrobiota bacterium]MBL7109852.1 hypothetical protein [Candidatus Neomarinimicrobiota bacterium]